jgi:tetratricopeptide (TPR) repeat protein
LRSVVDSLPLEIAAPLRMAGQAVPMVQGLLEAGQRKPPFAPGGPSTGGLGGAVAPFTMEQQLVIELYDSLKPDTPPFDSEQTDIVSSFFARAVSFWPHDPYTALQLDEQVLEYRPDDFDARHLHAALVAVMGDQTSLIADADELIRVRPSECTGFVWRSLAYLLGNDVQRCLAESHRALQTNSECTWSRVVHGLALMRTGNHREAMADFDAALRITPGVFVALLKRAEISAAFHDYRGAVTDLSRALELRPNSLDALVARCEANLACGELDASSRDLSDAIKLAGDNPSALLRLTLLSARLAGLRHVPAPPPPPGNAALPPPPAPVDPVVPRPPAPVQPSAEDHSGSRSQSSGRRDHARGMNVPGSSPSAERWFGFSRR